MPASSSGSPRPVLRPRRNPRWIAAGILAICLGAIGSFLLYTRTASANTVIAMNATVMRGATITDEDITQITVGTLGDMPVIDSSHIPDLVGKQALVDLPKGALVLEGTVGVAQRPDHHTQVGIKVPLGRLPVALMPQGTPVRLISVTPSAASSSVAAVSVVGTVATAPKDTTDGARVLDVWVPTESAAVVARLAALEQIAIVMEAP